MKIKAYTYHPKTQHIWRKIAVNDFSSFLSKAWRRLKVKGVIKYDPAFNQKIRIGPFEVIYAPGRAARPEPQKEVRAKVTKPHVPCNFDNPEILERETIGKVVVKDREYRVMPNIFPILDEHFLLIRPPSWDNYMLSQHIQDAQTIEDLSSIHQIFLESESMFFNSNPGRDSASGASKNHFHLQIYPFGRLTKQLFLKSFIQSKGTTFGYFPDWHPSFRIFEGFSYKELGEIVYAYLNGLHYVNNAYNLIFQRYKNEKERIVLVPRTKGKPSISFKGIIPTRYWGGDHYGGSMVEVNSEVFKAMQEDPQETIRVLKLRIAETTADISKVKELDKIFQKETVNF